MARVSLIEPDQASAEVKQTYDTVLKGKPANVHKAIAHRPDMLAKFLPFYGSVGRSLDRKLYELIYIRVSVINGCNYCLQHHLASSKRVGVTPEEWQALKKGDHVRFGSAGQAALDYAEKLTTRSAEITGPDVDALKRHFSEEQIVDLHMLTGLVNLTNRFTGPLGLEVEFPQQEI